MSQDRNADLFNSLYEEMEALDAKKQSITVSEFKPFLPLFCNFSDGKIPGRGSVEEQRYQKLSSDYHQRVNVFKSVKVIDDVTGEVVVVLPPHFSATKVLDKTQIARNENFYQEASHDFPGVAEQAHRKLQAGFILSQELKLPELQQARKASLHQQLDALRTVNPDKFAEIMTQFDIKPTVVASDAEDDILNFTVDE